MSAEAVGAQGTSGLAASAPTSIAATPSFWSRFKAAAVRIEKDFAVLKLSALGLLGTLIGGYFQSLSAYQDKVSAQAKEDMTSAADTLS